MPSIFKRKGRNGRPAARWTIAFFDYDAQGKRKRREVAGTFDLAITRKIAAKLESEADARKHGLIDPVAEALAGHGRRPIAEHLDEFAVVMEGRGGTMRHVERTRVYIDQIAEACGFATVGAIDGAKVSAYIADLKRAGKGARAINCQLGALKSFTGWLYREDRIRRDPMKAVKLLNVKADPRHVRRALTDDELARLLATTASGPDWTWRIDKGPCRAEHRLAGRERFVLYSVATETGLRAGELASLTPASFDLADAGKPTVTVEAAYSKHRRRDTLPIRADLAALVAGYVDGLAEGERIFDLPPRTADMLRADLQRAGIPYADAAGRVVDFHSLRHTFITRLVRAGIPLATVKLLARHSTIVLTVDRYSHLSISDERSALDTVPALAPARPPAAARATGTDDVRPHIAPHAECPESQDLATPVNVPAPATGNKVRPGGKIGTQCQDLSPTGNEALSDTNSPAPAPPAGRRGPTGRHRSAGPSADSSRRRSSPRPATRGALPPRRAAIPQPHGIASLRHAG